MKSLLSDTKEASYDTGVDYTSMFYHCLTNACIVGDSNPTNSIVSNSCHLPGTPSPVLVVPVVLKKF